MPFDDEDPMPASASAPAAAAQGGDDAPLSLEDALGDEMQDFRLFASLFAKSQASGRTLRRGEKDFEPHGTRAQEGALEASRAAMHEVLSYTRSHKPKDYTRAWYFPDKWVGVPATGVEEEREGEKGSGLFAGERVVAVEGEIRGPLGQNTGRVITGIEGYRQTPGWLNTWLLPEEALYLVERGSLDLWWPARGIEDIFPVKKGDDGDVASDAAQKVFEDYELGVPMSFQAAYALLIGQDGERGKISLDKYQVYANLRRTGYKIMRATAMPLPPDPGQSPQPQSLWQWLFSLLSAHKPQSQQQSHPYPPYGPLVKPGLYRSYNPIFAQLALIRRHAPSPTPNPSTTPPTPLEPFDIHFHVWKSSTAFSKTRPPPPDFRVAVADARASSVPTLEQLTALLERRTPWDPPPQPADKDKKDGGGGGGGGGNVGLMYRRLKHAWRNAVVAVVDRGLISYVRFGEMAFAEERLYERIGSGGRGGLEAYVLR
ncbi:hypothetical protein Hte_003658 [Hypoxylon texense]